MSVHLEVGRMSTAVRMAGSSVDASRERAGVDGLARHSIPRLLAALLEERVRSGALPADARVAVRRLRLKLRVCGASLDLDRLAQAWSEALADQIAARASSARAAIVDDELAVFPTSLEAERRYLLERLRGGALSWWASLLFAEAPGGPPERTETVLRRWVERDPAAFPYELARLVELAPPEGWEAALTSVEADAVLTLARRAGERRWNETLGGASSGGISPTPGEVTTWARALSKASRVALRSAPSPALRRLLTYCLALDARPTAPAPSFELLDRICAVALASTAATPADSSQGLAEQRADPGAFGSRTARAPSAEALADPRSNGTTDPATPTASYSTARSEAAGSAAEPASVTATPDRRPRESSLDAPPERTAPCEQEAALGAPERASAEARIDGEWVGCSGLLFLVLPVARSPVVRDLGPCQSLTELLVATGGLVLERLLSPLPADLQAAALRRERPVLEVFSGARDLPEPLTLCVPEGRVRQQASRVLDVLLDGLPAGVAAARGGVAFTCRALDPYGETGSLRQLANLVLRPGRLSVTRTHADLVLPLHDVDLALRMAGLDLDPGWQPHLGRVLRFHYEARP